MARIGFDNCKGYLEGGIEAWRKAGKETRHAGNINAQDFEQFYL